MTRRSIDLLLALSLVVLLLPEESTGASRRRGHARRPASTRSGRTTASRRARVLPVVPPSLLVPYDASARDRQIAEACRRGLEKTSGAVVAMDPYSGRVLAIVNPHDGVNNAYQPCSVFKIVVAIAGLTEGVITPETQYNCIRGCWLWPGHGLIDLRGAIADSCNTYFQWVGEQLGYEKIQRYASLLGLGSASGINVDGESPGRLPSWVAPSAVGHLSSHADGVTTSAVQIAVLLSTAINGGVVYQPQLSGPNGFVPKERWRLPPQTVFQGLTAGFLGAVNEGSASDAFDPDIAVGGKTGTCAGVGWFASYGPADKPEVVIVVFTHPGTGHKSSALAGRIYQDIYKGSSSLAADGR